jgi:hypothetical protein
MNKFSFRRRCLQADSLQFDLWIEISLNQCTIRMNKTVHEQIKWVTVDTETSGDIKSNIILIKNAITSKDLVF